MLVDKKSVRITSYNVCYTKLLRVHIIEFGSIYQMDEKFRNLYALYTHGWDAREWNLYTKVNLKYNGQIVCTK